IIHTVTTFILSIFYVALFTTVNHLNEYRQLFVISVGIMYVQVFTMEWLFHGMEQFKLITVRSVLTKALAVLIIFVFVSNEIDTGVYYSIILLAALGSMLINIYYAWGMVRLTFVNLRFRRHF